jgi:hypothetical protein
MEEQKMKKILAVLIVLISTQYIVVEQLNAEVISQEHARKCIIEYRKLMEIDSESKKLSDRLEAWGEECAPLLRPSDLDPTLQRASKRVAEGKIK